MDDLGMTYGVILVCLGLILLGLLLLGWGWTA